MKARDVKSGFRKLVVDGAVWQWRQGKVRTEIRVPGNLGLKWIVPTWQLQGYTSETAWREPHKDCYDECVITGDLGCGMWAVTPGMVRKYIDEMRKATC